MNSEMTIDLVDDTLGAGVGAPTFEQERVAKYFKDGDLYFGTVNKHFPAGETSAKCDLWEILYDDGDSEDLNQLELEEALDLYQVNATLDNKKPPTRRVTLSPVFQSESEEESENNASDNESDVDIVFQSAARKRGSSNSSKNAALDDKKPPARRAKLSPAFEEDLEEDSENNASENESDIDIVFQTAARKRGSSNGSIKKAALDDNKPPARRLKLSPAFQSESEEEEGSEKEESVARKRHFLSDSSSEEEESDDDTTPTRLSKLKSQKARKKYARLEQQAWLGGGDDEFSAEEDSDEDSELEAEEGFHRYELEPTPSRRQRTLDFGVPPPTPVALTQEQQCECLASIVKPADKALQKLLLNQDFQFTLLPHQFLAVRKVAGVPGKFPLHPGSQVVNAEAAKMHEAVRGLDLEVNKCTNKGVLIADDMGLGKTVEAIAGAVLRNGIAAAKKKKARPTVIVSPNDAVQVQWRDTLIKNGILLEHIHFFEVAQESRGFDQAIFLLLTRYTLQSEVRRVFSNLDEAMRNPNAAHIATSVLFPHAELENLKRLKVQYQDENTKTHVQNDYRYKDEPMSDCVARLIHLCTLRMGRKPNAEPVFETVLIDEAHFLKNITTFWGMGAALLSTHAHRSAPLTGTPYNNGPTDLATMMTFVDAGKSSARKSWWKNATMEAAAGGNIRNRVAQWHAEFLVRRRKEDVLDELVEKSVEDRLVSQYYAEQIVYNSYEAKMEPILKAFAELLPYQDNPAIRKQLKELHTILMAIMSSLRAANIHAMLPGGREYTKQFSPTRCHTIGMEERSKSCVCCDQNMRPSIFIPENDDDDKKKNGDKGGKNRRRIRGGATDVDNMEEFKETNDDAVEMHDEEEEEELAPLPCSLCEARNGPVSHFAHQNCIDKMKETGETCPRCKHAKKTTQYILPSEDNRRYCTHINGGFSGSSKLNAIVDWHENEVPQCDKVLILSFYKASLDLLEGIFCHDRGIDCARFDGDLDRRTSIAELERFKSDPDCKILLASVQSGGVGLNIVEANHVAFVDRWYNPFVHLQAEDRCHRIGQTKNVNVVYFDCAATVDEAMLQMNKRKKENSAVLLADGVEIGNQQSMSYQELSGVLGNLLSVIRSHRTGWLEMSPGNKQLPIPPVPQNLIAHAMEGKIARNLSDAAAAAARQETSGGNESKPKANAYTGKNGTEDVVVIDEDMEDNDDEEEEAEFESME